MPKMSRKAPLRRHTLQLRYTGQKICITQCWLVVHLFVNDTWQLLLLNWCISIYRCKNTNV